LLREHLKKSIVRLLWLCSVALLCSPHVQAQQVFQVGIHSSLEKYRPEKVQQIKQALASSGLQFEYLVLPNERTLRMASYGNLAIDMYRQPLAMKSHKDMVRVPQAVDKVEFWLYTHPTTPNLCNRETHAQQTVVGVLGIHWFENYIYPKFKQYQEVSQFSQAFKQVASGRVGVSLLTSAAIEQETKSTGWPVKICGSKAYLTLKMYSYVHRDFSFLIPQLEQAYQLHFGP